MPIAKEKRPLYKTASWFAGRAAARERAKDRCERCNHRNGSWVVRERGRSVEVTQKDAAAAKLLGKVVVKIQCGGAHLNNVAGDDRPENIAWLCRGCHLHHDKPYHRLTRSERKDLARPLLAAIRGAA